MQSVTLCHAVPFSPFQKMFCPARRVCGLLGSPGGGAAGCAVNSVDLAGILTHGGRNAGARSRTAIFGFLKVAGKKRWPRVLPLACIPVTNERNITLQRGN